MAIRSTLAAARLLLPVVLLALGAHASGIYPPDHWTYSTKLTEENFDSWLETTIASGRTAFVRWIASEG
jgi:hypothetical protein